MIDSNQTLADVKKYYGKVLGSTKDLQTNACCTANGLSTEQKSILSLIDDEIIEKFYGCGSPIPALLEGLTVLDLGCGTGRDVYLLSKLVGESGKVIGVDMTDEQLAVARSHAGSQAKRFGFSKSNVDFRQGYIEDLAELGVESNSVDIVVSNCVINLSPDKSRVFSEIFRVLKPGGELYFSDVFASRRVPLEIRDNPVFYGECLGGALYIEDFRRMLSVVGCPDFRVMEQSAISINNKELERQAGMLEFSSLTIRAFKLASLEDRCEDYGQVAIYKGTIPGSDKFFILDDHHLFETNKPHPVCGNSAAMIEETRLAKHFTIIGDRTTHFGLFDCAPTIISSEQSEGSCC